MIDKTLIFRKINLISKDLRVKIFQSILNMLRNLLSTENRRKLNRVDPI